MPLSLHQSFTVRPLLLHALTRSAHSASLKKENHRTKIVRWFWQGHKDLNPEPTVLETAIIFQKALIYQYYFERYSLQYYLFITYSLYQILPSLIHFQPFFKVNLCNEHPVPYCRSGEASRMHKCICLIFSHGKYILNIP